MARKLKVFSKREDNDKSKKNKNHNVIDLKKRKGINNSSGKFSNEKKYTGYIEILKSGSAWVNTDQLDIKIFIPRIYTSDANDGDEVEVILIKSPKMHSVEGKVVSITKRNSNEFVGELEITGDNRFFAICDNGIKVKLKNKKTRDFDINALKNKSLIVVEIMEWEKPVRGRIIEVLGDKNEPHVSLKKIARKHGFTEEFKPEILKELDYFSESFISNKGESRTDIRNEILFTVDPTDAKDFDDAITINKNEETGSFDLGVHIADVSAYISEGSLLDKEAFKRSFSLYLPSSVIPMLPVKLSNQLCSLNPNIDRLALSCFMKIDKNGRVLKYHFKETIINSKKRFDYKTFQQNIDLLSDKKELSDEFKPLENIFKWSKELKDILKQKRLNEGSIEFNLPEIKINIDKESGKATDIFVYKSYESNKIIEEFMLAANRCTADFLTKKSDKLTPIYRIHDKPNVDKILNYFDTLEENDIKITLPKKIKKVISNKKNNKQYIPQADSSFDITDHKFVQEILEKVKQHENGDVLTSLFLRSMMKAKYSIDNIGHYGLAFDFYTHFTSPIRRYPDLMVHRMIKKHLKKLQINKKLDSKQIVDKKSRYCSIREIKSIKAEYEARDLKIAEYMYDKVGNNYSGQIVSITQYGAYIKLNEIPIEGMLHIKNQKDDRYEYKEDKKILKGIKTGKELSIGSKVDIILSGVDKELLLIDFILNTK